MKADTDPDVFLLEIYQLRDELSDLDELVSNERLTTIIIDALPAEKYSTIKVQAIRDPALSLKQILCMMKMIFLNHLERLLATKKNEESNCRGRENGRESAVSTFSDTFCITHVDYIPSVGVGKEGPRINWSMGIPEKTAPVTGTTLRTTGPVPADSRQ